jgi:hypothetical protein
MGGGLVVVLMPAGERLTGERGEEERHKHEREAVVRPDLSASVWLRPTTA